MKIWLIIGAAFMLPLCASNVPHVPYTGDSGDLLYELAGHNFSDSLAELKRDACINKYFQVKASEKLQPYRDKIKKYIKAYSYSTVYSFDGLEAVCTVVIPKGCGAIIYCYYDNDSSNPTIIEAKQTCKTNYTHLKPFFTKKYLCCNLSGDVRESCIFWDRRTEKSKAATILVYCGENEAISYDWVVRYLPRLQDKINRRAYPYTHHQLSLCQPPGVHPDAFMVISSLIIDLTKMKLLTSKELTTMLYFYSNENWRKIKNQKKHSVFNNILACYGKNDEESSDSLVESSDDE